MDFVLICFIFIGLVPYICFQVLVCKVKWYNLNLCCIVVMLLCILGVHLSNLFLVFFWDDHSCTLLTLNNQLIFVLLEFIAIILMQLKRIWRPPSLSELTPMLFNTWLTHFCSEASILSILNKIWMNYLILMW